MATLPALADHLFNPKHLIQNDTTLSLLSHTDQHHTKTNPLHTHHVKPDILGPALFSKGD